MRKIYVVFLFFVVSLLSLSYPRLSLAKTDISISDNDITFSKNDPLDGDLIRIYARIFNSGDVDVFAYVDFLNNGKKMAESQPISIKASTYDDVFIDWKAQVGTYDIAVKIAGTNPLDENTENNETIKKSFLVDKDTDVDGTGDTKDPDADNDGLANEEEKTKGTDPLKSDTDGDGINDKVDVFAADKNEWRDTDSDGIGDNIDTDTDGDELTNQEEMRQYGTNPLSSDSDNDGLLDKKEVEIKTDPNKTDTDSDGIIDSKDKFPLDINKTSASLMDSIFSLINSKNSLYLIIGAPLALLFLFLLFRRRRRRK